MSWDESPQPWGAPQTPPPGGAPEGHGAPYGSQPGYGRQPDPSQYPQNPPYQQPQYPQQTPYPQQQPQYAQPQPAQSGYEQGRFGQAQYGDPQYGQAPFGQQPFGQPQVPFGQEQQYPQQQFGYAPTQQPKKGKGLIIGLAVGALVVAAGAGTYFLVGNSNSKSGSTAAQGSASHGAQGSASTSSGSGGAANGKIALASSAGGLHLLTTSDAKAEVDRVRSGVSEGGAVYKNALIGAYGPATSGGYRMVVVDQPFTNLSADYRTQFTTLGPDGFVQSLTSGMSMSGEQTETTSAANGALSCGNLSAEGQKILTCVWDDGSSFGLAYFYTAYYTTDISAAAQYTDAVRAAAESG